jgi:phage tail sheath protein FI
MSQYQAPGVYTKINSSGNKPLESCGSSTAAFVGLSTQGAINKATLVTTWAQFQKEFGTSAEAGNLAHAVYGFFLNGGSRAFVVNVGTPTPEQTEDDVAALIQGQDLGPKRRTGLHTLTDVSDVAMVAAPGFTSNTIHTIVSDYCTSRGDRMAILDGVKDLGETQLHEFPRIGSQPDAAMYWPWIHVFDEKSRSKVCVPPSGHVCGVIARVDSDRGVHKPPANEVIRGALGLEYVLSREEHALFNPRGINIIRNLDADGIRVYGARTLSSDPEWKYLNVRRLFKVIQKSIQKGTEWVVFEPNNEKLWSIITRNISNYLKTLFTSGALVGSTPEEAFYVRCDKSTNPPENVDLGIVTVEIGVAPVKPAEFVQINIQQKSEKE